MAALTGDATEGGAEPREWVAAIALAELKPRSPWRLRHGRLKLLLLRVDDRVYAYQANCPHQAYPLAEGTLGQLEGECILTCPWHNWKFSLGDGRNLLGGDRLRVFPTRVRQGTVEVDLTLPDQSEAREHALASLGEALDESDYGRMARELVRFHRANGEPLEALARALTWTQPRLRFGWTHALPGAADWLQLRARDARSEQERLLCLLEPVYHLSQDGLRHELYPYPLGRNVQWDACAFSEAVEAGDDRAAGAQVAAALRAGVSRAALDRAMSEAALAHYNDFGHSLIYACKARELLDILGAERGPAIYPGLARAIVYAVREDETPDFRDYQTVRARLAAGDGDGQVPQPSALIGLGVRRLLDAVAAGAGAPPSRWFETLLAVNAWNLLHFDTEDRARRIERDDASWLDLTHGITFADAVAEQCRRWPDLWPAGLVQLACFAGRNARYTHAQDGEPVAPADEHWVNGAVRSLLDRESPEPIVHVHRVKTTLAVRRLLAGPREPHTRTLLLAGLRRYLSSPLRRANPRRTIRRAFSEVDRAATD
jgi:nitrite reductase/ring-hydroxylating ferredoxin subunit